MNNIDIKQTEFTPSVLFDTNSGVVEIKGNSLPENTFEFYAELMDSLKNYFENPKDATLIKMEINYFNSSSSKLFFDLFDLLDECKDKSSISVQWHYDVENESMEEAGEDFKDDFEDLDFQLVKK